MKQINELKRTLMAFSAIISVPSNQQNVIIKQNITTLLNEIIKIAEIIDTKKHKHLAANSKKVDFDEDYEEEEDDEAREKELNDFLTKHKATTLNDFKSPDEDDADDDLLYEDDEEDEDWDEFSSMTNITPFDKLDEILNLKNVFGYISQTDQVYYNEIMKILSEESKAKLENCVKNAEARNVVNEKI